MRSGTPPSRPGTVPKDAGTVRPRQAKGGRRSGRLDQPRRGSEPEVGTVGCGGERAEFGGWHVICTFLAGTGLPGGIGGAILSVRPEVRTLVGRRSPAR